jgi:hypothetical protein
MRNRAYDPLDDPEIAHFWLHKGDAGKGGGGVLERNISRVIEGTTLRGTYSIQGSVLTVNTPLGSRSTQVLKGSKASSVAYVMLGELYYEARADALHQF